MWQKVLPAYGINVKDCSTQLFGNGLINSTWRITAGGKVFILQRINHQVFKNPQAIAGNIQLLAAYLSVHAPGYLFTTPVKTLQNEELVHDAELGYFRMFPFVTGSHTIDVVNSTAQAYEAAKQFGKFTKLLAGFDCTQLQETLPDFHNLSFRYQQFENALAGASPELIAQSKESIDFIKANYHLTEIFEAIKKSPAFKKRVTHHDTKISNILLDDNDNGLCVIDLDTIMPGYFISDVGDMIRTYVSPVSEEEKDFTKIEIREDYFAAIVDGYLGEMQYELSKEEIEHFVYAGKFMIYMQAIRFLADHLMNNIYYGASYPNHNLYRANNQITLLKKLMEKEEQLQKQVSSFIQKNVGNNSTAA
jgi:Ser/Thr protein kinase RdoA (MazF antagonist)